MYIQADSNIHGHYMQVTTVNIPWQSQLGFCGVGNQQEVWVISRYSAGGVGIQQEVWVLSTI